MNIEDKRKKELVKLDTLKMGDVFNQIEDGHAKDAMMLLDPSCFTESHGITLDEAYENSYACVNLEWGWIEFINKEEYVEPLYSKLIISVNEADIN